MMRTAWLGLVFIFLFCSVVSAANKLFFEKERLFDGLESDAFVLDFSRGFGAVTGDGRLSPLADVLPELLSENRGFVPAQSRPVVYPANHLFKQKCTVEIVFRRHNDKDTAIGREHLFSFFKSDTERFYFRFENQSTLHLYYSDKAGRHDRHYRDTSNIAGAPLWNVAALQFDISGNHAVVELFINARKAQRWEFSAAGIEFDETSRFYLGSWRNGEWAASHFEIGGFSVSEGHLYDSAERLSAIEVMLELQTVDLLLNRIASLERKRFLAQSERKQIVSLRNNIVGQKASPSYRKLFELTRQSRIWVERIEQAVQSRQWNADNTNNALITALTAQGKIGCFVESAMVKIRSDRADYRPGDQSPIALKAARHEYESFQLVIASFENHDIDVEIRSRDLTNASHTIQKENISVFRVHEAGGSMPDALFRVEGGQTVPSDRLGVFWCTLYVPPETPPGVYSGSIDIGVGQTETLSIPIRVRVWNFSLPVRPALKTSFGLSPEYIQAWTPNSEHRIGELTDRYVRYMLEHRTTPKSYLRFKLEMPDAVVDQAVQHGGQPETVVSRALPSNIGFLRPRQILRADGSIELDFSLFDRQIEEYLDKGLNTLIAGNRYWEGQNSLRSVLQGGKDPLSITHHLWVYDELLGHERTLELDFLSDAYKRALKQIFSQWQDHLTQKGWLDMAFAYAMDEPTPEMFPYASKVYSLIHEAAPRIPNMITHTPIPELEHVDIWCPLFSYFDPQVSLADPQRFWFYVSTDPKRPYGNFFLYQEPLEHRILFWQTFKYDGVGFLYWEVNYWPRRNPLQNLTESLLDHEMDGSLLYPGPDGPIGTIRYEIIRDGIEDYDYLHLLRQQSARLKGSQHARCRQLLRLSDMIDSPAEFLLDWETLVGRRNEIGELLDEIFTQQSIQTR